MDRRQKKTRNAIFQALSKLLETTRFEHITVQQIIDEADIGRSTFYAHFETKDELLKALCTDIFQHVFSEELIAEQTHDFSSDNSLRSKVTHILYHLREKKEISNIFTLDSSELFVRCFRGYLVELFSQYEDNYPEKIPAEFVKNHLAGSFVEMVRWWCLKGMKDSPEEITEYYMTLIASTFY